MKTIYAVNSGSYSDYRIDALFSSKEKAKEFMAAMKKNDSRADYNDIEEYQLDPPTIDLLKRRYFVWGVIMLIDGTVERVGVTPNSKDDIKAAGSYYIWERTKTSAYQGKGVPDALRMTVWAKTAQAAVKIVNEKRAQMIATGEWK